MAITLNRDLLRKQTLCALKFAITARTREDRELLEGAVTLLESIQDAADSSPDGITTFHFTLT